MTQRRKALSVFSAVGVLLIGAAGMFLLTSFKAEAAMTEQPVEIRTVRTRILLPGPQTVFIESEGFLRAARRLEIHSSVAGRVSGTLSGLKGGISAEEGDVLVSLDDRKARLAFESARTEMIRSSSGFMTSAGLSDAERSAWKGFLIELEGGDIRHLPEPPLAGERLRLLAATMGVVGAWHSLEYAAFDLADHQILAPFSGTLSGEGLSEGAWVSPGTSLAVLVETGRLELQLSLPVDDMIHVTVGDPVGITRGEDTHTLRGEVVRIEPLLTAGSQTARVHVVLEASAGEGWLPGTFVNASVAGRSIDSAYRVPRGILVGGRLPVFADGRLVLRPVTVLAHDGSDILLAADMPLGTELVVTVLQSPVEGLLLQREEVR